MKKLIIILLLLTYDSFSQSLSFFDIDTSAFPTIKAKFYAFDASGNQILNLSQSDFEVTEDGVKRNVTYVLCLAPTEPVPLSSVLTIDVSGSMSGSGILYAKEAAKAWVQALPLGQSECAITSFNSNNFFNQDFTTNKNRLLNRIEELRTSDGTDFNAALINPMSGGLLAVEKGKYKKVVILLTDGYSSGNESAIVQKTQQIGATIFCVTVGTPCPQILQNIAQQTRGLWFENITTAEQARDVYLKILNIAQGGEACDIEWESGISCKSVDVKAKITLLLNGTIATTNYKSPIEGIADLVISPSTIKFLYAEPGIKKDTIIRVKAKNRDFTVTNITSSNPAFVISPQSFTLAKGQSKDLTVSFIPSDSGYIYTKFEIINDVCPKFYYCSGGFPGKLPTVKTIKLLHPNGSEVFVVGADTVITWEGITPEEPVKIEYTTNNGTSWELITDNAKGLIYNWKIPKTPGNQCLARVTAKTSYFDEYPFVQICDQTWMSKNLDVEYYRNGDLIPEVRDSVQWKNLTSGAWCYFNNDLANGEIYGKLYNWYAVNDPRGLAPEGWHIPSDEEWKKLEMCLGMSKADADTTYWRGTDEGGKLKETSNNHWMFPNKGATNESGFTALPGGYRHDYNRSEFENIGINNILWSSTNESYRCLAFDSSTIYRGSSFRNQFGFSIRCIKN